MLELLKYVYREPKSKTKFNTLIEKFGDIVDDAKSEGLIVSSPGYNQPCLITRKGKEFFGKIPSNIKRGDSRGKEFIVVFVDITGKTYKPGIGKVVKEHYKKNKYYAEIKLGIEDWDLLQEFEFSAEI